MKPWIRLVALADMWTDSCQQDALNQRSMQACISPLPLAVPDRRAANPISLFCDFVCFNGYP